MKGAKLITVDRTNKFLNKNFSCIAIFASIEDSINDPIDDPTDDPPDDPTDDPPDDPIDEPSEIPIWVWIVSSVGGAGGIGGGIGIYYAYKNGKIGKKKAKVPSQAIKSKPIKVSKELLEFCKFNPNDPRCKK